eukprot:362156-Chlamydomonas_euryale.AAC.4
MTRAKPACSWRPTVGARPPVVDGAPPPPGDVPSQDAAPDDCRVHENGQTAFCFAGCHPTPCGDGVGNVTHAGMQSGSNVARPSPSMLRRTGDV